MHLLCCGLGNVFSSQIVLLTLSCFFWIPSSHVEKMLYVFLTLFFVHHCIFLFRKETVKRGMVTKMIFTISKLVL